MATWTSSSTRAARLQISGCGRRRVLGAVKNAFRILMSDPSVRAVFINIFGASALRRAGDRRGRCRKDLRLKVPVRPHGRH